jgi:hypothetical protein
MRTPVTVTYTKTFWALFTQILKRKIAIERRRNTVVMTYNNSARNQNFKAVGISSGGMSA